MAYNALKEGIQFMVNEQTLRTDDELDYMIQQISEGQTPANGNADEYLYATEERKESAVQKLKNNEKSFRKELEKNKKEV